MTGAHVQGALSPSFQAPTPESTRVVGSRRDTTRLVHPPPDR